MSLCEPQKVDDDPPTIQPWTSRETMMKSCDLDGSKEQPDIKSQSSRKTMMKGCDLDGSKEQPDIKSQIEFYDGKFPPKKKRKGKGIDIKWVLIISLVLMIKSEPINGNEISTMDITDFEDQFQASPPINAEPLFALTENSNLKTVKQNNTTLQLQTWKEAPHVMIIQNSPTPSYKAVSAVIDLAELAVMMKNSLRYLEHHNHLSHYIDSHIYGPKRFFAQDKNSSEEFMMLPGTISKDSCTYSCNILNASLPVSLSQIQEGSKVLNTDNHVWINAKQSTQRKEKYKWRYHMYLEKEQKFSLKVE